MAEISLHREQPVFGGGGMSVLTSSRLGSPFGLVSPLQSAGCVEAFFFLGGEKWPATSSAATVTQPLKRLCRSPTVKPRA